MAISTGFHTYLNTLSNGRFNRKCCCLQAKPEFAVTSACAPACGWELYKVHPSLPLHATVSRHHAGRTPADFPLSCHVFSPSQGTASNACPWCASLQGFKGNFAPSIVDSAQMPAVTSFFKPLGIQTGASSFVQRFSSPVCSSVRGLRSSGARHVTVARQELQPLPQRNTAQPCTPALP